MSITMMYEHLLLLILTLYIYIYDILYLFFSRGVRNDASLVPPIRQTASIFKQPVTIYKTQEGKVKDIKHGNQEKPKQVSIYYLFLLLLIFLMYIYVLNSQSITPCFFPDIL